ncbi:MAG: protein kinase domain-containing protein [Planctomycetaceae bacterium]|jgi:hypothetical protein
MEPSLLTNLLEAQESAWNEQRCVTVEELLSQLGSRVESGDLVCELVIGEIMLRRRAGDRSDLSSEIRSRFPSLPAYVFEMAARPELASVLPLGSTPLGVGDTAVDVPVVAGGTQAPDAPAVPGYTLLQKIGEGGFGDVWIARNQLDGSPCAVKVLTRHVAAEVGSLQAYQSRGAEHTHLITIRHAGVAQGIYYYVMPLADRLDTPHSPALGDYYVPFSLRHWLSYEGPVPAETLMDLLRQVLLGLRELHRQSLAHCDIKPDNLLRVGGVWKLADIGLASNQSGVGERRGTRAYWPPEVVEPRAADLYALGVTAFVAVTGRRPQEFQPDQGAALGKSLRTGAGRRLARFISRACDPRPERRYPSAAAMLDDLLATSTIIPASIAAGVVSLGLLVGWGVLSRGNPVLDRVPITIQKEFLRDGTGARLQGPIRQFGPDEQFRQSELPQLAREVRQKLAERDRPAAIQQVRQFLEGRRKLPDDLERRWIVDELLWVMDDPLEKEDRLRLLATWRLPASEMQPEEELEYQRYKLSQRERFVDQIPVHVALSKIDLARMVLGLARVRQDALDAETQATEAFELLRRRFEKDFPERALEEALADLPDLRWADFWRIEAQRRLWTQKPMREVVSHSMDMLSWWRGRPLDQTHPEYAARLIQNSLLQLTPVDGRPADRVLEQKAASQILEARNSLESARERALETNDGDWLVEHQWIFQKLSELETDPVLFIPDPS